MTDKWILAIIVLGGSALYLIWFGWFMNAALNKDRKEREKRLTRATEPAIGADTHPPEEQGG